MITEQSCKKCLIDKPTIFFYSYNGTICLICIKCSKEEKEKEKKYKKNSFIHALK